MIRNKSCESRTGENLVTSNNDLTATFARIAALNPNLEFSVDIGQLDTDRYKASDFANPELRFVKEALARQDLRFPGIDKRTSGAFLLGNYAWYVPVPAIASYLVERRVPDLSPENIGLRNEIFKWEENGESGENERLHIRFLSNRFAALPDDPAAGQPNVTILPDMNVLREWLRTSVETLLTPVVEQIYAQSNLGRHAQWSLIADSCAAMFLYIGGLVGDKQWAQTEGLAFVKAAHSPMNNPKTGYVTLQYENHCETFRARGGCCRYYKLPEHGKCDTCVLRTLQDRDELLLTYMKKKHSKENSQ
jgi:hypothetical protein